MHRAAAAAVLAVQNMVQQLLTNVASQAAAAPSLSPYLLHLSHWRLWSGLLQGQCCCLLALLLLLGPQLAQSAPPLAKQLVAGQEDWLL